MKNIFYLSLGLILSVSLQSLAEDGTFKGILEKRKKQEAQGAQPISKTTEETPPVSAKRKKLTLNKLKYRLHQNAPLLPMPADMSLRPNSFSRLNLIVM